MLENEQSKQESGFWDMLKGKFARLHILNAAAPIRCRVIDVLKDPIGRDILYVVIPGQIKFFIYFDQIIAYEIYDSIEQLQSIVQQERFDNMRPNRDAPDTYFGEGVLQP